MQIAWNCLRLQSNVEEIKCDPLCSAKTEHDSFYVQFYGIATHVLFPCVKKARKFYR